MTDAVAAAGRSFGGIDIVVNNASAIDLRGTEALDLKRYDLMQDINTRGTFAVTKACVPHLREAANPHILTLSPPIGLKPQWLGPHIAYTIAKYGMSLCALGWAEEFREAGIASNALWPRTLSPPPRSRTCSAATPRWPAPARPRSTPTPPTRSSPARAASAPATPTSARTCSPRRASPICRHTPTSRARELQVDLFVDHV